MAGISIVQIFGHSGAEKSLLEISRGFGFQPGCFDDISNKEQSLKAQYSMRSPAEFAKVEAEIKDLEAGIDKFEKIIESKSFEITAEISLRIKNLEVEIDKLENIKFSLSSLFSYLISKLTLHNKKRLYLNLKLNPKKEIDKLLKKEYSDLQSLANRCTYLKDHKENEVKKRLEPLYENLANMEKIKNSNEYKGAVGELKVIKNLEGLPEDYFLLNDVFLEIDEYITFNNSKLKSAQIDHLVVGPTGVYVIEAKNWSYNYVQKVFNEDSYTPCDQIERSSYLTYRYLNNLKYGNIFQKAYFNLTKDEIKVKSIIAVTGADIPHTKGQHTRVTRSNELSNYIQRRAQIFSYEEAHEITEKLSSRVSD